MEYANKESDILRDSSAFRTDTDYEIRASELDHQSISNPSLGLKLGLNRNPSNSNTMYDKKPIQ